MPDIYLLVNETRQGPFQPEQIRTMLAEGQVTLTTLSWQEGMQGWAMLAKVMGTLRAADLEAAAAVPIAPTPVKPEPAKPAINTWALAALIIGGFTAAGILFLVAAVGLSSIPVTKAIGKVTEKYAMQNCRVISLALQAYAEDHHGDFPQGDTSTQVFPGLLDDGSVSDPRIFYLPMSGKSPASTHQLMAENVCYDVTSGPHLTQTYDVPFVFSCGYLVTYSAAVNARRDPHHPPRCPAWPSATATVGASWMISMARCRVSCRPSSTTERMSFAN